MSDLFYKTPALIIVAALFALMLLSNFAGHLVKQNRLRKYPEMERQPLGAAEGALLGLLALLLSFTFGMSASRNDAQRQVLVHEANAIGTVMLRCDLYADSARTQLRQMLLPYVEARIAYYNAGVNEAAVNKSLEQTAIISGKIWQKVAALSQDKDNVLRSQQMVPALNEMIDIVSTRETGRINHIPISIFWVLFLLALTGSFVMGYGAQQKRFNWILNCGFTFMAVITIYLIIDLDRPRRGIINMDATHKNMLDLREALK